MRRSSGVADWVYRSGRWLQNDYTTREPNNSGSYGTTISVPAGPAGLTGQVLYDADNVMRNYGVIDPASGTWLDIGNESRPQGADRGALIHGVEVHLAYRPTTWALGSRLETAYRIVVADQDGNTGQAQIDVDYSLWENITLDATGEISRFANGRQNCGEGRRHDTFADNRSFFGFRKYHKFKRRLMAQEGLFLLFEVESSSVNISALGLYCRTLVTDGA